MKTLYLGISLLIAMGAFAQGGVGINNTTPHASALLDITGTNQGLLLPQVNLQTAVFPAPGPATSLLVYNTNAGYASGVGFYYNSGTEGSPVWVRLTTGAGADNLGNHTATQNILLNNNWLSNDGNNEGLRVDNAGNVGIGTGSPAATLDIAGTGAYKMPVGTQAQRPSSPVLGMMRYNTTVGRPEFYDGTNWRWISYRTYGMGTGGNTVQDIGGYRIHTFTSSGTFTCTYTGTVEVLVVAGGGGGAGSPWGGGGGGGGGVIYHANYPATEGPITVTVGAGGAASSTGGDSYFGPMRAFGGGAACSNCGPGGSGGGTSHSNPGGGNNPSIQTSNNGGTGYGNYGGNAVYTSPYWTGSGGGAGAPGVYGGAGGAGMAFSISGSTVYYAGGGGQVNNSGSATGGGIGGGGSGVNGGNGVAGTPNSGGGGGGSRLANGGAGGSGIVIVRYPIVD